MDDMIAQADLLAAQYDYSGAIQLLKSSSLYTGSQKMQDAADGVSADDSDSPVRPIHWIR